MTPGFTARRRAEEFSSLVEGTSTQVTGAARHGDTLALVESLRQVVPAEPRADFVADLRRQLMTEAATVLTPTAARLTVTPRRTARERRIAVAIGGFAVVSATTSMAMAAQTALPGETLYPLKRAIENASTTIKIDEDAKGATLLTHASGRLDEVDALTRESDDTDADVVADTLHAFADQAASAADLMIAAYADSGQESDIEELRSFTAQSMSALDDLETAVPDTARAALIEAAQVINQIDAAAIQLCPVCAGGVAQVPEFAAAPLEGLLADLGAALSGAPADATSRDPSDAKTQDGAPQQGGPEGSDDGGKQQPGDGGTDNGGSDAPDDGGPRPGDNSTGGSDGDDAGPDSNVIDDLTDRLIDGKGPRNNQGGLGGVLDDALGNVGGLVNNLLGD